MNAAALRTAGRYLGMWVAIVLGVGLVSFTFTFLGTLACAALVGMMMGALKGEKWFSAMVSLVFPAILLAITHNPRTELTSKQILILTMLGFGTFWATYLVSRFMFFCEQKERKPSAARPSAPAAAEPLELPEQAGESCLEQLQGKWVCEAAFTGKPSCRKVIQIKAAKLELQAIDVSGHATLLAQGEVTLQSSHPS